VPLKRFKFRAFRSYQCDFNLPVLDKAKTPPGAGGVFFSLWLKTFEGSGGLVSEPICQMKEFSDLPPFVSIFDRLLGMAIGFSEGVLVISYHFVHGFHGLGHSSNFLSRGLT
jgi:hypothetical protein